MIQNLADLLFPLETGIESRIVLEIHQWNFYGDRLSGLPVDGLEDRAHAAPMNRFDNLETIVQYLPHLDIDAAHRRRTFRFTSWIKGRQSLVKGGLADLFDPNHLNRNIILGSTIFCGVDEIRAGIRRSHACNDIGKLMLHEQRVQPVGTKNEAVSVYESGFGEIHLNNWILAERARQNRPQLARHRVFLRNQAKLTLHFDVRVIRCELLDLAVADQINAAVTDVPYMDFLVAKDASRQRGPHSPQLGFD